MTVVGVEWQEFERTGLVDQVAESLRAGRSVLVMGEAGVGKTTVVRQAAPDESEWIQGLEGLVTVALAPFSLIDAEPPLDSVASAYRWLREQAENGTTLVVDDAQWIDPVSAGLLSQAIVNDQIRAIVSVRSGHALGEDLARAVTRFDRLTVTPLDSSMVELALELALGSEPDPTIVQSFTNRSGGNPLYLRELVLEAVSSDALSATPGQGWALVGSPPPSANLQQLIEARLGRLDDRVRQAVELVTVADHLPTRFLVTIVDASHVATAIQAGLLRETADDLYPGHPTVSDAIAAQLSTSKRNSLLSDLVDASETESDQTGRHRRLKWQLEIGQVPSPEDLDAGYHAAVRAADLDLAGQISEVAYTRYPSVTHGLRVANQRHRDGNHRQATELVESLVPLAETPNEAARIASHLLRTQGSFGLFLGTSPDAGQLKPEIVDWADSQLEGKPLATLLNNTDEFLSGDFDAPRQRMTELLDHPVDVVRYGAHERQMWQEFAIANERSVYEHAIAYRNPDDPYFEDRPQLAHILFLTSLSARSAGRAQEAYERISSAFGELDEAARSTVFGVADAKANICHDTGRVSEGLEAVRLARSVGTGAAWLEAHVTYLEARLLSLAGRHDESDRELADGIRAFSESSEHINDEHIYILESYMWFHRAAYGTHPEAISKLRELAASHSNSVQAWFVPVWRARLGDVDEELADRLGELTHHGVYTAAHADLANARLAEDSDLIAKSAIRFEEIGTHTDAIEALSAAIVIEQGRGGNPSGVKPLIARHQDLLARCPGLRWPLATIAIDAPDLTARERQIAELAALGWSNRQISDELSIAVRTAENNLQRAYTKLGINRRADLTAALGLQPA